MRRRQQQPPEDPNPQGVRPGNPIGIPTREALVDRQFAAVLAAVGALNNMLAVNAANEALDNGTKFAMHTSIIKLLTRLDAVTDDNRAWDVSGYDSMDATARKFIESQEKVVAETAETQRMMRSPHLIHRPALVKLKDGNFAAILGDIDSPAAVFGVGRCPAEALDAFDNVFCGRKTEFMRLWEAEQKAQHEKNQATVDRRASGGTSGNEAGATPDKANRKGAGPKRGRRGKTAGPPEPKGKIVTPPDDPDMFRFLGGS